jgi:hypothetical protein
MDDDVKEYRKKIVKIYKKAVELEDKLQELIREIELLIGVM